MVSGKSRMAGAGGKELSREAAYTTCVSPNPASAHADIPAVAFPQTACRGSQKCW